MVQMFPDDDDRKAAQDSIDRRLRSFGKNLWVPTREEYLAQREAEEARAAALAAGDTIPEHKTEVAEGDASESKASSVRKNKRAKKSSTKKPKQPKQAKVKQSSSSSNSNAVKSVRRRKR